ncbi:hypothetical protein [Photobacterium sp. J15]|nr:hypothetical protein [Photobacterium sp. J15]
MLKGVYASDEDTLMNKYGRKLMDVLLVLGYATILVYLATQI